MSGPAMMYLGGKALTGITSELAELRVEVLRLRAHEEIRSRIYAYARAVDRLDRKLLEEQFWPHAHVDYGGFYRGPVAGFIGNAMRFQGAIRETQHLVGNVMIDVVGDDRARAESYIHVRHVLVDGAGLVQLTVGVRYLDRFERRASSWKLSHRTEVMDWGRWFPMPERWFEAANELPKGLRSRNDLSYRFAFPEN
jgi:hypothetical protein